MVDMIDDGSLPCAAGQDSGCGQVKLSLSYDSGDRRLSVLVHSCRCVGGVPVAPPTLHCCWTPQLLNQQDGFSGIRLEENFLCIVLGSH